MTLEHLRRNYKLQFYFYCSKIRRAVDDIGEDLEDRAYKLSDDVGYYKSKRYPCFRTFPLTSKLNIAENPDLLDDRRK